MILHKKYCHSRRFCPWSKSKRNCISTDRFRQWGDRANEMRWWFNTDTAIMVIIERIKPELWVNVKLNFSSYIQNLAQKFNNFPIYLRGFILNYATDINPISWLKDCYSEWFTLPSRLSYSAASAVLTRSCYDCHLPEMKIKTPLNLQEYWHKLCLKGKSDPLQAWSGLEGSRKLRFPDFMTMARDGGKVVSLTHRPPLPPGNIPVTGWVDPNDFMSKKNSNDTSWDRTSDLPICSTAP